MVPLGGNGLKSLKSFLVIEPVWFKITTEGENGNQKKSYQILKLND